MAKKTVRDFSRKQIREIATSYANSGSEYSHSYYEKEYNISSSTFYNLLEKAVVEHIVDMDTVRKMAEKAANNSREKAGEAGAIRSQKHYGHLALKRRQYCLPKTKAAQLTREYSEKEISKEEFARQKVMTVKLLGNTIKDAIAKNWVSDRVVKRLKEKSLAQNNSQDVQDFWKVLEAYRSKNKNQG